jgi:hypothetical protein
VRHVPGSLFDGRRIGEAGCPYFTWARNHRTRACVTYLAPGRFGALTGAQSEFDARESWEVYEMVTGGGNKPWEDRLREAGSQLEDELRKAIRYLDEEVVPEVRKSGSAALRTASDQLRKLAEKLDDERRKREGSGR